MKFAKSYVGLLVAVCACMFACTSENGDLAGTVTDTGNTIAMGVVTRTDGSRAVSALVRIAREPSEDDSLSKMEFIETKTDSQGVFSFDSVLVDTFQLAVIDAEYNEISYKPRAIRNSGVMDSIKLEKAAVFSSVLYYENVTEPSVAVGSHFEVFMPGTPFSQSVFAGDSFSMLIPAGEWWFGFCPGDPQIVARLADSGVADSLIYRTWNMNGKVKSGDTLAKGPFIWSPMMEVDSLIKLEEQKKKEKKPAYLSGVVNCKADTPCAGVQVQMITDLFGFDFVEGDSVRFVEQTVTDSSGRWFLKVPESVPYDSLRMEYRMLDKEGKVSLAGVSRYVLASELKKLKDTLSVGETELIKPSVLVSGVLVVIDGTDSTQTDNCMANSVVVGLKGTSHFVREMVCNMLKIENLPAGGHDIVLYSGDPKVVKSLQDANVDLSDYVTITHVQLPKNDTLSQQWMTYAPPTIQTSK
ncbi:MAG: carboxypeptidase regulatory-like domain-containing protein [Fibrobacter sp.]|nr:carboxypeptidase regulatory-like domain-containing protein [Fibrobacter sp.]